MAGAKGLDAVAAAALAWDLRCGAVRGGEAVGECVIVSNAALRATERRADTLAALHALHGDDLRAENVPAWHELTLVGTVACPWQAMKPLRRGVLGSAEQCWGAVTAAGADCTDRVLRAPRRGLLDVMSLHGAPQTHATVCRHLLPRILCDA